MADKIVSVKLVLDSGQYQAEILNAGRATTGFANTLGAATQGAGSQATALGRIASGFGKAVTIGVAGGLALSAKAAIDFESSFAGVQKTLDASPEQFARLSSEIRDLATDIPIAVNELNRIAELGGQLGVSVGGITDFTETIAKIGETTTVSTETAALSLARLNAVLGFGEDQYEAVGSALVELGNNFETTEDQILNFALRIAPIGATVGLTVDQVLAIGTAMSSAGVTAERGSTAVQTALIGIAEAASTGGDELEVFAKVAGTTAEEFAELFERDAAEAFDAFLQGLVSLEEQGVNVFAVLDELGLGSKRTVQALLALGQAGDKLSDTLQASESGLRDNIALQEEFARRADTTAAKIQLARNRLNDIAITLGENLLPVILTILEGVQGLGEAFAGLPDPIQGVAGGLIAVGAAGVIGFNAIKLLARVLGIELAPALEKTTGKAALLRTALGGIVTLLAGVAISALLKWGQSQVEQRERVEDLTEAILEQNGAITENIRSQVKSTLTEYLDLFNQLEISVDQFVDAVTGDAGARGAIEGQIEDVIAEYEAVRAALSSQAPPDIPDNVFDTLTSDAEAAAVILGVLTGRTEEFGQALEAARIQQRLDLLAEGFTSINEKEREDALGRAARSVQKLGDSSRFLDPLSEEFERVTDAADEFFSIVDDNRDTADAFVDTIFDVAEQMQALAEETNPTVRQILDLDRAVEDARRAARELGPEGLDPIIRSLEDLRTQNIITQPEFERTIATLLAIAPTADIFGDSTSLIAGNIELVEELAKGARIPVAQLIGILQGTTGSFEGFVGNVDEVIAKLEGLVRSYIAVGQIIPEFRDGTIQIREILEELERLRNLGGTIIDIPGITTPGGGGGGGGSSPVDDLVSGLQEVLNTIGAIEGQRDAIDSLAEAEENLRNLRREQRRLPDEIADAEERLRQARRNARAVTLDEQLAIEAAEERLARARLAREQGLITDTELAKAEQELEDARSDAVNVADDPEVVAIREELKELRARRETIVQEIVDGEEKVIDAKLRLISSQETLNDASERWADITEEQVRQFRRLARQAGLTRREIEEILALAGGVLSPTVSPNLSGFSIVSTSTLGGEALNLQSPSVGEDTTLKSLTGVSGALSPTVNVSTNIERLVIRGVWDFASPQAIDRLIDNLFAAIEERRLADGVSVFSG